RVLPVRCIMPVHFRDALLAANECIRQFACLKESAFLRLSGNALPELLGEPDEKSFGAADVAEPIRVFVPDHFADEHRAAFAEPGERIVDVLHGEHDAKVAESVHRGAAVIGDHRGSEESGNLEPAVTVRRAHHGNLDAHVAQSSDAICPGSFDGGAPLELEAKLGEELNGGVDVFYHDADVVHTLDRHDVSLARLIELFVTDSCAFVRTLCTTRIRAVSRYATSGEEPSQSSMLP